MDIHANQSEQAQHIISQYQRTFTITKKYSIFLTWCILGLCGVLFTILWNNQTTRSLDHQNNNRSFTQSWNAIQAKALYIFDTPSPIGYFQAYIIWWWYLQENGKYISKNNFMTYKNIALPQHFTTTENSDYIWWNSEQQTNSYIQKFIMIETGLLLNPLLIPEIQTGPQVSLKNVFHLSCLWSKLLINADFCNYNLEQFTMHADEYDLSHDYQWLEEISSYISKQEDKNALCKSILNYEMKNNDFNPQFKTILSRCDPSILKKQNDLIQRKQLEHELDTVLSGTIYNDSLWNQFKVGSSMQILQSQIQVWKIDIRFLASYYNYILKLLQSDTIDNFTLHLIYKYHNQYLIPGLIDLFKTVNVDTSRDIQNMIDKLDTLNNGDNVNLVGLRYRVNPEIILATDYASTHLPLGQNTAIIVTWSSLTGVDNRIINTLIGAVDISINQSMNSGTTNSDSWIKDNQNTLNGSMTKTGTQESTKTPNTNTIGEQKSNTSSQEDDLNSYRPKTTPVYSPSNSENKEKTIVSDRMLNHLWIKPDIIIAKGSKYFVEREYKWFTFSSLIDRDNDRKLSPIYVKIDNVRTIIPDLVLYLMDYDRYSQVKFLKNPESYIRQASQ